MAVSHHARPCEVEVDALCRSGVPLFGEANRVFRNLQRVFADGDGQHGAAFRVAAQRHALTKPAATDADRKGDCNKQDRGQRQPLQKSIGNEWQVFLRLR
ncbi:hypothetical protein D3C73_986530 [compost metagenome]